MACFREDTSCALCRTDIANRRERRRLDALHNFSTLVELVEGKTGLTAPIVVQKIAEGPPYVCRSCSGDLEKYCRAREQIKSIQGRLEEHIERRFETSIQDEVASKSAEVTSLGKHLREYGDESSICSPPLLKRAIEPMEMVNVAVGSSKPVAVSSSCMYIC